METYKTIAEAREHAKIKGISTHILEIEPGMIGINPYLCTKCNAEIMRKALKHNPMPEIKRVIGVAVNLEKEAYDAQQAMKGLTLEGQREELKDAEYNSYSEENLPGSKAWQIHNKAAITLKTFDAEHPETIAALTVKKEATRKEDLKDINIWNL